MLKIMMHSHMLHSDIWILYDDPDNSGSGAL